MTRIKGWGHGGEHRPGVRGSAVTAELNDDVMDTFAAVFSKLSQRVLWKRDAKVQSGHPKTRLLIYHGGSHGVMEAIYHGVPMIIIPLFGDQYAHAVRVQEKGMGVMLDKSNLTEESVMEAIREVIDNPKYKQRVQHFSNIHHDAPLKPLERAVYWIEHVMKFGGDHLRPRSADMNFIELYMIDTVIFLSSLVLFLLYVEYLFLKKCYRCVCNRSTTRKTKVTEYESSVIRQIV
ncbi:putative UDP-glucuronosyltransferase 2C1 [Apostichopus japonicus]|uniref:Putative UDP-glucuronosyltransferase 2C1 n=1 Tax=Stichopus japonicus TaxID=307972 RepID=A0A2G8JNC6_STIJA|nr:putative UDP-glucuronosyltransferase 2C1 [Apostichopus japonicus]